MSGPFKAAAPDLRNLADFLDGLAKLERDTGCSVCVYGPIDVAIDGAGQITVRIRGEAAPEGPKYVIDDRIGD